jgi:hypothetical protein
MLAASGSRPSDMATLANLNRWPDHNGETGKWTARRILKLLNNRVYVGEMPNRSSTLPGTHPAIVNRTQFDKVQEIVASRRTTNTQRRNRSGLSNRTYSHLSGILICGQCNRAMSTSVSYRGPVRYLYYRCRSNSGGQPRCSGVNIGVFRLEQLVASVLADIDDPSPDIPLAMREQWQNLHERERHKRLPQTIHRVIYSHSTGEITIEIKPEAIAEFEPKGPSMEHNA